MPNPFLVSDLDTRPTWDLISKASEYQAMLSRLRDIKNPTTERMTRDVEAALELITAEIERRRFG